MSPYHRFAIQENSTPLMILYKTFRCWYQPGWVVSWIGLGKDVRKFILNVFNDVVRAAGDEMMVVMDVDCNGEQRDINSLLTICRDEFMCEPIVIAASTKR